jgi:hypothetical protein
LASGEVITQCFERDRDACTPCNFPLESIANFCRFKTFNEGGSADTDCVTDLEAGESRHQLPGSSLANTEDPLNGLPVQIVGS